jgi:excisionase family DNA binding protein
MDDIKKYLTVRDVAKKLGLTEEWIRDLIAKKEIKAIKIGQWRIKKDDLENFMKSRSNV